MEDIPRPNLELDEIHAIFVEGPIENLELGLRHLLAQVAKEFVRDRPFWTKEDGMRKLKNYYEDLPNDKKWSKPYYKIVKEAFIKAYEVRDNALERLGVAENAAQNGGKKRKRKKKSNRQRRRPKIKSNRLKRRTKKYKSKRRSSKRK